MADNLASPPERQGIKMDPTDDAHTTTHRPPGSYDVAGDVIPLAGDRSMGAGPDSRAVDYAIGKKSDPKVLPMPATTTTDWAKRQQGR